MLEKLHEHVVSELGHSSRTDTIFIVVAVLFNLLVLGINSGAAGAAAAGRRDTYASSPLWAAYMVFAVFVVMTILVNAVALGGLFVGRQTRQKLLKGLIEMYTDNQVAKYYDPSLLTSYGMRYILFGAVILILGFTAIAVPLVVLVA